MPIWLAKDSFVADFSTLNEMLLKLSSAQNTRMTPNIKTKLRTCDVCNIKKNVVEFSNGKICKLCEIHPKEPESLSKPDKLVHDKDITSLHTKLDMLTQRLDRMEELVTGLMELVGKINYDMEMNKHV